MAVPLATRLRALWLVILLVLAPAGPAGLILSGHVAGADAHAETAMHNAADHGIAAGALPVNTPDRHCPYCQTASSLRFGWIETPQYLRAPASMSVDWIELQGGAPRSDSRAALPARAPDPRLIGRPADRRSPSSYEFESRCRVAVAGTGGWPDRTRAGCLLIPVLRGVSSTCFLGSPRGVVGFPTPAVLFFSRPPLGDPGRRTACRAVCHA